MQRDRSPGRLPALATLAAVLWAAASLAALAGVLGGLAIDRQLTAATARANLEALGPFWAASASGWAALTALLLLLRRGAADGASAAARRRDAAIIVGVALLARLAVLLSHEPALSDDVHRYVFDGRNLAAGVNPYLVAPASRLEAGGPPGGPRWPGELAVAARVNNPRLHTIYLPTSQWVFAAAALAAPDAASSPESSAAVFRAAFVLFDVAAIALLLMVLGQRGRSPWWAALYAWHPLAVTEIAGSGHQDAVGIALLVAALLLTARRGPPWRWTPPLAAAALVKPVALPVAAFALKGRPWRHWLICAALGAVACAALAAPLLSGHDGEPLRNLLATAERFRLKWAHFGPVYEPVLWTVEHLPARWTGDRQEVLARGVCAALLAAVLAGIWLRSRGDVWADARIALTAMIVLSPVVHPWYLLWVLALVPVAPGPAAWVLSLTLPWSYAAWGHVTAGGVARWGVSPWLMVAAWAPALAAPAAAAAWRRWAARGRAAAR